MSNFGTQITRSLQGKNETICNKKSVYNQKQCEIKE